MSCPFPMGTTSQDTASTVTTFFGVLGAHFLRPIAFQNTAVTLGGDGLENGQFWRFPMVRLLVGGVCVISDHLVGGALFPDPDSLSAQEAKSRC